MRAIGGASTFSRGASGVYLVAALACLGIAAYMAFGQHRPIFSVAVIAPAIGGLWFLVRLFMVAPRAKPDSRD